MADEDGEVLVLLSQELGGIVPRLMALAAKGGLPESVRGTAWRLFLRVVPPQEPESWAGVMSAKRQQYEVLRRRARAALDDAMARGEDDDGDGDDDDDEEEDDEDDDASLEAAADQIRRDCERCYLEGAGDHFLDPARQRLMFSVLLTWAHEHAATSYRQGMHEVLAPLLWALETSFDASALVVLPPGNALHALLPDAKYVEADVFWLFEAVMALMAPYYASGGAAAGGPGTTPVLASCERVQGECLRRVDAELHDHLNVALARGKTQVLPQVYMLGWLRIMYGRLFSVRDTLVLWDAFFSTAKHERAAGKGGGGCFPSLAQWLEAVGTVLIVLAREDLLQRDALGCLQKLLRYEAPEPVFLAKVSRRLIGDDSALEPLVAVLRQRANLSTLGIPDWVVSVLSSMGLVQPTPATYDVDAVSYASSALQMGQTALCLAVVPPGDDLAALEPGADDGGRPAPGE